jgi:phosphatidylserine/phosphatidylglycerophosphate/cardiolipin synthase-like enzyme
MRVSITVVLTALLASYVPFSEAAPVSASCATEVGFSPEGSAAKLVDYAIESAHQSIRLAAYSFTAPDVVRALIADKRRGVDVQVVVDERGNRSAASKAALNLLTGADIPTRTISVYPIHHDKYIVIDGQAIETGSFNYSKSAEQRNSENALLVSACPTLARQYLEHWQSRWDQGTNWVMTY